MSENRKNLNEILSYRNLKIPEYQRPYEWSQKLVKELLTDIFFYIYQNNNDYVAGNIIIHKDDNDNLNIVDGQQRLTTISLLIYLINKDIFNPLIENSEVKFKSNVLKQNYLFINNWLKRFDESQKQQFLELLLSKLTFFYTEVGKIEEAFQLFDTQNSRGVKLSPADLLKAFHLQNMESDIPENYKIKVVEKWQELSKNKKLNNFIEQHLFRIRRWSRNDFYYDFTNSDISEFKGINVSEESDVNFHKNHLVTYFQIKNENKNKIGRILDSNYIYPFQINQTIINGSNFFDYIFYYYDKFYSFINESEFNRFYNQNCINYNGWNRVGDYYLRNAFVNLIFLSVDRFNYKQIEPNLVKIFKNFYFPRIQKDNSRIGKATLDTPENNYKKWFYNVQKDMNLDFIENEKDNFSIENLESEKNMSLKKLYKN